MVYLCRMSGERTFMATGRSPAAAISLASAALVTSFVQLAIPGGSGQGGRAIMGWLREPASALLRTILAYILRSKIASSTGGIGSTFVL